ncbi:Nitroreductase OS=Streptomyces cyaneofuscatus OX=66883 GN=G3I52_01045 PE=4 SV=1 [Streptomyces cyaneofuscatus]
MRGDEHAGGTARTPLQALLGTAEDQPVDWLRAGQGMERVLLQATLDGLATSLISQPLEWPELETLARDPRSRAGFVQMVFRFGYGPSAPATPRRPVAEVLEVG